MLSTVGCGDGDELPDEPEPLEPPTRTAVQDGAIRALIADVGESKLCETLQGRLIPLQEPDAPAGADAGLAPAIGRLWVESCTADRRGSQLAIELSGRGWTWADERRGGPLGSSFSVRGFLRFRTQVSVEGEVDLGYSEDHRLVSLWFSPTGSPTAQMTLLGEIPVQAQGGWSGIIGTVGEILGGPLSQQARPVVSQYGSALISRRLGRGITATTDLCSGQPDVIIGPLADGQRPRRPYPDDGTIWLSNERVRLFRGGIDVSGPWSPGSRGLRVDVESEGGPQFEARLLCQEQAHRVLEAYLEGRPSAVTSTIQRRTVGQGRSERFDISGSSCPVMLVLTPVPQQTEPAELRLRVVDPDVEAQPLVECGSPS
jgi:hypothetical protein